MLSNHVSNNNSQRNSKKPFTFDLSRSIPCTTPHVNSLMLLLPPLFPLSHPYISTAKDFVKIKIIKIFPIHPINSLHCHQSNDSEKNPIKISISPTSLCFGRSRSCTLNCTLIFSCA